jgi:hypothetical protein
VVLGIGVAGSQVAGIQQTGPLFGMDLTGSCAMGMLGEKEGCKPLMLFDMIVSF